MTGVAIGFGTCRLDDVVTAGAFPPLKLLCVTAHTALRRIAFCPFGNVRGVHGLVQGDELAFGPAFHSVTGCTGDRFAGMVTGFAVFNAVFVNKMVENHGLHADSLRIGFFADRKDDHG